MNLNTIVKPCQQKVYQQDNIYCEYDDNKIPTFSPTLLNGEYWQQQKLVIGTAQGRGTTYFIQYGCEQWVLRHYYRGGLVGRFLNDGFLFIGMARTRAAQEFHLLNKMQQLSLPVPTPVAFKVLRKGFYYSCDLLTERIVDSQDLIGLLTQAPLTDEIWFNIGKCIQQFHHHGIYHHDLNCHNILMDKREKIWLIDFDRGQQRPTNQRWQQANLARLLRSFRKEKHRLNNVYWQEADWHILMEGYLSA